jgi:hypothetical protein
MNWHQRHLLTRQFLFCLHIYSQCSQLARERPEETASQLIAPNIVLMEDARFECSPRIRHPITVPEMSYKLKRDFFNHLTMASRQTEGFEPSTGPASASKAANAFEVSDQAPVPSKKASSSFTLRPSVHSLKRKTASTSRSKTSKKKKHPERCGRCPTCKRHCGECKVCKNMTKFGGPGTHESCLEREPCPVKLLSRGRPRKGRKTSWSNQEVVFTIADWCWWNVGCPRAEHLLLNRADTFWKPCLWSSSAFCKCKMKKDFKSTAHIALQFV